MKALFASDYTNRYDPFLADKVNSFLGSLCVLTPFARLEIAEDLLKQ